MSDAAKACKEFLESRYSAGCSNNGCIYRRKGGVGTNAICHCGARGGVAGQRLNADYVTLRNYAEKMIAELLKEEATKDER